LELVESNDRRIQDMAWHIHAELICSRAEMELDNGNVLGTAIFPSLTKVLRLRGRRAGRAGSTEEQRDGDWNNANACHGGLTPELSRAAKRLRLE
jgi:hypothetical protein